MIWLQMRGSPFGLVSKVLFGKSMRGCATWSCVRSGFFPPMALSMREGSDSFFWVVRWLRLNLPVAELAFAWVRRLIQCACLCWARQLRCEWLWPSAWPAGRVLLLRASLIGALWGGSLVLAIAEPGIRLAMIVKGRDQLHSYAQSISVWLGFQRFWEAQFGVSLLRLALT